MSFHNVMGLHYWMLILFLWISNIPPNVIGEIESDPSPLETGGLNSSSGTTELPEPPSYTDDPEHPNGINSDQFPPFPVPVFDSSPSQINGQQISSDTNHSEHINSIELDQLLLFIDGLNFSSETTDLSELLLNLTDNLLKSQNKSSNELPSDADGPKVSPTIEIKSWDTENPDTENPDTQNPDKENPDKENPDKEGSDTDGRGGLIIVKSEGQNLGEIIDTTFGDIYRTWCNSAAPSGIEDFYSMKPGLFDSLFIYSMAMGCTIKCFACDHAQPTCRIHETCCRSAPERSPRNPGVCRNVGENFLMIRSCPSKYDVAMATRRLCEEDVPVNRSEMTTVNVVTDEITGVTYYNKYCALCNRAEKLVEWSLSVDCQTYLYVLGALNDTHLLRLSMERDSTCKINQEPKGSISPIECDPEFYGRHVIAHCNLTGQERHYDPDVEEACLSNPLDIRHYILVGELLFNNIFCLFCNQDFLTIYGCSRHSDVEFAPPTFDPPFQFLFGFNNEGFTGQTSLNISKCLDNEWMDPEGNCWELMCSEGKVFRTNHCETAMEEIRGLPYTLRLWLFPQGYDNIPIWNITDISWSTVTENLLTRVNYMLRPFYNRIELTVGMILQRKEFEIECTSDCVKEKEFQDFQPYLLPSFGWIHAYIVSKRDLLRDDVELGLLQIFNQTLEIDTLPEYVNRYYPQFVFDSSQDMNSLCTPSGGSCYKMSKRDDLYVKKSDFLELRSHLTCPYIQVPSDQVTLVFTMLPVVSLEKAVLQFGNLSFEIKDIFDLNNVAMGQDGSLYICLEALDSIVRTSCDGSCQLLAFIQYLLTIVVMAVSLVSLAATVITYGLFPSLRCVAGCNIMGLSLSLMIAQILLLVASHTPGPSLLCTIIGAITHFSWLVMFTWTFLCCLHMLRIFTASVRTLSTNKRTEKIAIAKNISISLLIPSLIVIVVIAASYVTSDGERVGFGHKSCALDNAWSINAPLIIVTTLNVIFFIVVVVKIWMVRRLQSNQNFDKKDRKDLVIYIKLSTLTGMFWLLVILGEVFENDVIRCFAIVTNGSQGAFIFASFILNRRVSKLYMDKLGLTSTSDMERTSTVTSRTNASTRLKTTHESPHSKTSKE